MSWKGRTADIERPPIAEINALASELEGQGRDLVNLGQAILGLPPPVKAVERVREWIESTSLHVYAPDPGQPEAREAVAGFLRERKGIEASADRVILTCGANQAFVNSILAVTRPGDEVVLMVPGYFDHDFAVKLAGCVVREAPLRLEDGRYAIDIEALEAAMNERTRAVVLVSPGNPSGMVATRRETERLCEMCARRDVWLVSDEVYDLLTFPPVSHVSPASLGIHEKVIVLGSFSKVFALASWRVGYYAGPADMIEESIKVQDALVVCAPVPSQVAAMGAIESVDAYVPAAVEALIERRDALMDGLRGWSTVEALAPEGGTFLLARLGVVDDVEFCKDLLRETGVVTVPGSAFGAPGCVRISFGNQPAERIAEACERMRSFSA
ncbi:MAG: aminotransferase class I/II-fold pyridoxal phosphate-dependent enzyme [Deltaproteobacteria bacterium]|nr:aminotransferase class I/II-fold pyridoxal phosphate-dependent enzyme [Deltaproteobacteria bacterium]